MGIADVWWELHNTYVDHGDEGMPSKANKPMERLAEGLWQAGHLLLGAV